MRYIGPEEIVPSVLKNYSYGLRKTGAILMVSLEDIKANPHLWEKI